MVSQIPTTTLTLENLLGDSNAKQAQENANTGRGSDFGRMAAEVANRGLQQNAESARDALLEYNTLRIKAPKKD